ncbi:signal peptidase I [Enterococcus asini]|uniref:signal peptidase I n=1 Tax=Enterococcus asini TaxID=57732 RepID=UPI00288D8613|nr:signal peptidase I [Enterococcus asini]MDT2756349.1 signal peptidase I [Enterococcus asini]
MEENKQKRIKKTKSARSLTEDILNLILKLCLIVIAFWLLFQFVFGLKKVDELGMSPNIKPEDIMMYYRLDKDYSILDPVVIKVNDEIQVRRVVAKAGDTVEVTEQGLLVNGSLQTGLEKDFVTGETLPFKEGVTYPLTLKKGELFVMADNREKAIDSRMYGPIKEEDTLGKIMWDLRRRNL